MFRKLVTNLPFNPSLISQVSFYTSRIKAENSIRRIGFVFVAITLTVQTLVFISPPERSLAASSNHIINGIKTRDDILNAWDQAGSDIPAIYTTFGVTRDDIAALPQNPNATIKSDEADYWSIGRNSLQAYSGVDDEFKAAQLSIQYAGKDTETDADDLFVYQRQLKAWDIRNPSNSYKAFEGTLSDSGETYWIIVDCGNFTKIGKTVPPAPPTPEPPTPVPPTPPTPPAPPTPEFEITKSIKDKPEFVRPGDTITYNVAYRNTTRDSLAEDVRIEDDLDTSVFNAPDQSDGDALSIVDGTLRYDQDQLGFQQKANTLTFEVTLKDQVPSGTQVCNTARIVSSNATTATSNEVCVPVIVECPFDASISNSNNPNCVAPVVACTAVDFAFNREQRRAGYKTTVSSSNPANTTVTSYTYDFGDGTVQTFEANPQDQFMNSRDHIYEPGAYDTTVTVRYRTTGQEEQDDQSITCVASVDFEANKTLGQSKKVTNITQDTSSDDEGGAGTVRGGDVLEYTIITTNTQNYARSGVDIADYIGDILDYADLDTEHLATQGGTFDAETNKVHWNDLTFSPNSSTEHTFRVTIKDPIPATNSPSSLGTSFDCRISNEYGNEITMNVDCPLVKGLETLPNTGAGSSMLISVVVTTFVGYFFARSRLLAKEIDIVRSDYVGAGV